MSKLSSFLSGRLSHKFVQDVPGVSPIIQHELNGQMFIMATQLLGQYLILGENRPDFIAWLSEVAPSADQWDRERIADAFYAWCEEFL